MQSQIAFDLENPADVSATVMLIPASLRRLGILKGKFLAGSQFKDETGQITLAVSEVTPGGAIDELNEYTSQLEGVKVLGINITTDNFAQATLGFIEKTYIEFKQPSVRTLDTVLTIVAGKHAIQHDFNTPFMSGPMKSLEMVVMAKETVRIVMTVELPNVSTNADAKAAILPQQ